LGNKIRITLGIKAAKTNIYYLLTPIAIKFKDWITAMSSQFTMQNNRIGYGGYEKIALFLIN
jgi:hypothetical protein